jgi:flagellar hook-associated protein 2
MATISSLGVGTGGLDSEAIVTKLVALEKQPLTTLKAKATIEQAKISSFGQIQSQFAALSDVATRISAASGWSSRVASSSNASAATIVATASTAATSFTLDVDALAKEQSNSSASVALGSAVGAGTLTFRVGTWSGGSTDAATTNADIAAKDALVASTAAASTAATNAATAASATAVSTAATAASALADDNTAASDLTSAGGSAEQVAYASAYSDWVAAITANDHSTPALQAAETAALAAKNNAYAAMTGGEQSAADSITATADTTDASALKGVALNAATASTAASAAAAAAVTAAAAAVTAANSARPTFTAGSSSSDVAITVTAADTVTTLAAKINASNAGVVATVFRDGTGERLLLRSKSTGADAGFRIQATDTDGNDLDNAGLSRFAYDPQTAAFGMATSGTPAQNGQDAKARINGLAVTSKTNTLTDNIPGVTITLTATTTTNYGTVSETKAPVTMAVREDVTPAVKNVQDFITAYNTLAASLSDMTKYDAATKTPSIFQGDSAVLGLQSILRNMLSSVSTGSTYQRLSDIGVERQLDGSLSLNTAKLSTAANNGTELQKLFTTNNSNAQTNGFALKFAALAKGVLGTGGSVVNKAKALQKNLEVNATEQTRVNDRADAVEARLRKQYTALDTKMAGLTALNAYVAQQVTTWNKSTS